MNTVSRQQLDQELQKALFFALNYDDNVNVRLKAAQALSSAMYDSALRQKMIASLAQQDQPEIQIFLIELLASFREKNAIPVLEQIIQNEHVLEVVRDKAAQGMAILL
jgi:HEAT repeat protein